MFTKTTKLEYTLAYINTEFWHETLDGAVW